MESRYEEEGFYTAWEPGVGFQKARSEENIHEEGYSAESQNLSGVKRAPHREWWLSEGGYAQRSEPKRGEKGSVHEEVPRTDHGCLVE